MIDLKAIRDNYRKLKAIAPEAEAAAVVKADAYGLGTRKVVPALEKEGCRTFFVATLREAEAVRKLSDSATIFVLDGLFSGSEKAFAAMRACPVLGSLPELEQWSAFAEQQGTRLPAALHVDTGMNRLGLSASEISHVLAHPELTSPFTLCLLMSHLACADEPDHPKNQEQLARFEALSNAFPEVTRSLANSAGVFLGARFHFDLTRPGIALYGGRAQIKGPNQTTPVVSLYGRIAQMRWAERGETVGYGASQTLKRRTRIATVSVGYADGYFRATSASDFREGPPGYIGEHRLPLLGRVSMDLTTFDATDVPEQLAERGGLVELLGEKVTVDDLAAFAGTIGYEVLTSLGRRYHRVYLDE